MANIAKLKKRALDFEQKKQFDKALEVYAQILEQLDEHVSEADMALYNRVGDLLQRKGDIAGAVDHYEKAVDLYTESGFFNNAIALCNKVLRNAPGRSSVYYKLGRISAKKGFINDAKQNFLEYADRMQQAGDLEEAFRALKEFADLCPDQDDIRLMLADQLVRKDRKTEAIEQLQHLYEKLQAEGRGTEARATLDRMRTIDPAVQPRAAASSPTPRSGDLVFLDIDYDDAPAKQHAAPPVEDAPRAAAPRAPAPRPAAPPPKPEPLAPLPLNEISLDAGDEPAPPFDALDDTLDIDLPLTGAESLLSTDDAEADAAPTASDAPEQDDQPQPAGQIDGLITGFDSTLLGGDLNGDAAASGSTALDLDPPTLDIMHGTPAPDFEPGLDAAPARNAFDADSLRILPSEVTLGDLPMLDMSSDDEASGGSDLGLIMPSDDAASLLSDDDTESPLAGLGDTTIDLGDIDLGSSDDAPPEPPPVQHKAPVQRTAPAQRPAPPPAPAARASDRLRQAIAQAPNDWPLHRLLAEALFEEGDRAGGLRELETAMLGMEAAQDLNGARSMAEEIIRVEPNSVRHHQKRVEYAVRLNDRARLIDAYADLAEALFRAGELDKARVVYGRVLDLAPNDARVRAALEAIGRETGAGADEEPEPPAPKPARAPAAPDPVRAPAASKPVREPAAPKPRAPRRGTPSHGVVVPPRRPTPTPRAAPAVASNGGDEPFVNLGEWLRDDENAPKSTRMVVDVKEPAHEEQVDFADMLAMFKQGVEANVDEGDYASHYDLGVAYKEMGLLDEAISEFQKSLRGASHRVRSYEALGQCFVEKEQYQIAVTILNRALGDTEYGDDVLIGVLYLLGLASEKVEHWDDARRFYGRVCAVDIQFRDVRDRLAAVERHTA